MGSPRLYCHVCADKLKIRISPAGSHILDAQRIEDRIEEFGGARSVVVAPALEQIPFDVLEDVAAIFAEGIPKYGERSWLKGVNNRAWKIERWKHALLHLWAWLWHGNTKENNLAKVTWFCLVMLKIARIEADLGQDVTPPLMAYPPLDELRKDHSTKQSKGD
jgi:hypothetical protein